MDAGFVGKCFLVPTLGFAQGAVFPTEALTDVHALLEARLSTINLQTISDIDVDFRPRPSGSRRHLSSTFGPTDKPLHP